MGNIAQWFAAQPPEKRKAMSSKGGKFAHRWGLGHRFTAEELLRGRRKSAIALNAPGGPARKFTSETGRAAGLKSAAARRRRKMEQGQ